VQTLFADWKQEEGRCVCEVKQFPWSDTCGKRTGSDRWKEKNEGGNSFWNE
jgi:hypothetical protein